jgi:hypothetical protein
METEGSLPHSQQPTTCLYPERQRSSPCPHLTSRISILILLYRLLTFHVPDLFFIHYGVPKDQSDFETFATLVFLPWAVSTSPNPQAQVHTPCRLSATAYSIFVFAAVLHIWRPFLEQQPEKAPWCGNRDPLITEPWCGDRDPLITEPCWDERDPLITEPCCGDRDPLITEPCWGDRDPLITEPCWGDRNPLITEPCCGDSDPLITEPCCGDRDPLITSTNGVKYQNRNLISDKYNF